MANIKPSMPVSDSGGNGELVYFLHANGYPPECYLPLIERLSIKYHVVSPLLRPLWDNCPPESIDDWEPLSRDFIQLLETHGTSKAIVIGHSLGSVIGLRSSILAPELFRAIILLDPVIFPPLVIRGWKFIKALGMGDIVHPLIPTAKQRRRSFESLDAVFGAYRQKPIFKYIDDEKLRIMIKGMVAPAEGKGYKLVYSPEWEVRIYYTGVSSDLDLWENLRVTKIPIIIIRGSRTNTFLPLTARRIKKTNPEIRIETVDNSSHLVPIERPDEVSRLILNYLENMA